MISGFQKKIMRVRAALWKRDVSLRHYYLDDGANMTDFFSCAIKHEVNMGLAKTLVDGYNAAITFESDAVIRLDAQEHDPWKILEIVDCMEHSDVGAVFLPVYYWVEGELRPSMREVQRKILDFSDFLSPVGQMTVLATYNQTFPLGYQAFRSDILQKLVPRLEEGLRVCEEITGKPATWGLDLLSILLIANMGVRIDSFFGGWSTPWKENRTPEHINAQREKARVMVEVAKRLGCKVI